MKDLLVTTSGLPRIDLDKCYLPFVAKALDVLAICRTAGQDYMPTSGFRSWGAQHQLRMNYLNHKGGMAVPAGLSAHNYGLAWDMAADKDMETPGLQPIWRPEFYAILGKACREVGLIWGGSFNDMPHIQWPDFVNSEQLRVLQSIWKGAPDTATETQKLTACWAYIDALSIPVT